MDRIGKLLRFRPPDPGRSGLERRGSRRVEQRFQEGERFRGHLGAGRVAVPGNTAPSTGLLRYGRGSPESPAAGTTPERRPWRQGVQPHAPITRDPGLPDDRFGQHPAHAKAAEGRPHVEPLHLADALLQPPERHAARDLTALPRQQEPTIGRGVARPAGSPAPRRSPESRDRCPSEAAYSSNSSRAVASVMGRSGLSDAQTGAAAIAPRPPRGRPSGPTGFAARRPPLGGRGARCRRFRR